MSVLTSFVQGRWVEHDGAAGTPLVDPLTGTVAAVVSGAPVDRRAALAWARGRGGGAARADVCPARSALAGVVAVHSRAAG